MVQESFDIQEVVSTAACDQRIEGGIESPGASFCTFAVTGPITSFQSIFICRDCFSEDRGEESPLCICQACAERCHDDHDVEFIGMGPCYCDCNHVGTCPIFQESQVKAEELLGTHTGSLLSSEPLPLLKEGDGCTLPLQEVFEVPDLLSEGLRSELVHQAQELIQHSKETFWIDKAIVKDVRQVSTLECLAWKIYQRHMKNYSTMFPSDDLGGAEWWVQIKDPQSSTGINSAIDLHYDKDEALAEVFGLGLFPTLSTVTYLTTSATLPFNPTLVLDHTYVQGEGDMIDTMLVSKPVLGKHLVFDGRLLHGAPAHQDLKSQPSSSTDDVHPVVSPDYEGPPIRVTFLVNIWNQRPANVQQLPEHIRGALLKKATLSDATMLDCEELIMKKKDISVIAMNSQDDLPERLQHRIELPFVSKGSTWENRFMSQAANEDEFKDDVDGLGDEEMVGDDDDDGGLVVVTFPPPPMTGNMSDTLLLKFGPGLQAYLDYPDRAEARENDHNEPRHESAYV